jgi:WD40-like Beta Propeller Repeat
MVKVFTDRPPSGEPTQAQSPDDLQALFREARRRRRIRRAWWTGGIALALLVARVAVGVTHAGPGRPVGTPLATARVHPYVNAKAFSHQGTLAFISQDTLWVLDGSDRSVRDVYVPKGLTPMAPTISPDGKWLAYLARRPGNNVITSELWIAEANGTGAREVSGLAVGRLFGWSPSGDLLGVTTDTSVNYGTGKVAHLYPTATAVQLVEPDGSARQLVAVPTAGSSLQIENAVWSPNGHAVAVSTWPIGAVNGVAAVTAYPVSGGKPTPWFSIASTARLPGICTGCGGQNTIADLAGWWSKWGIGFWVYSSGATHNFDNTALELLTAPGATPRIIGKTLSGGETDAISANASSSLAIVASTAGRSYGVGKEVEVCERASLACSPLPGASTWTGPDNLTCPIPNCGPLPVPGTAGSGVTLDPEWSPNGTVLAYVKSPQWLTPGWPSLAWYAAHELFVWNPATNATRQIADISGISVPTWSRNGKDLLYVANDGLWLVPVGGGNAVEIEHPLFPLKQWDHIDQSATISYYGQIAWNAQFSWSSP